MKQQVEYIQNLNLSIFSTKSMLFFIFKIQI